jgi:hypothetical protein
MTAQEICEYIAKEIAPIYERFDLKSVSINVDWKPTKVIKNRR